MTTLGDNFSKTQVDEMLHFLEEGAVVGKIDRHTFGKLFQKF